MRNLRRLVFGVIMLVIAAVPFAVLAAEGIEVTGEMVAQLFVPADEQTVPEDQTEPVEEPETQQEPEEEIAQPKLPDDPMTRLEFCRMIVVAFERCVGSSTADWALVPADVFTDTNDRAVNVAYTLGIVNGIGGTFLPDTLIVRQEAAVMLANFAKALGQWQVGPAAWAAFADSAEIPYWARTAVDYVQLTNLIDARAANRFAPRGNVTVAQGEQIAERVCALFQPKMAARVVTVGTRGVWLRMPEKVALSMFGVPDDVLPTAFGVCWKVYAQDYNHFVMISMEYGFVNAICTNAAGFSYNGVRAGDPVWKAAVAVEGMFLIDQRAPQGAIVDGVLLYTNSMQFNQAAYQADPDSTMRGAAMEIFYMTNAFRVKNELAPYQYDADAAAAAAAFSARMAKNGKISHREAGNVDAGDRLNAAGIAWRDWRENIASGQKGGVRAYYAWLNSETHRESLLVDCEWTGCGAAVADGVMYYVQVHYTPAQ